MSEQDGHQRLQDADYRHDLKEAIHTLRLFATALKGGYSFDDAAADEKRRLVSRAIDLVAGELGAQLKVDD